MNLNNYISKFKITMKNSSILRVSSTEDEILIQKNTKYPIIQGSSLAGALRDYLGGNSYTKVLFGDNNQSKIYISDAIAKGESIKEFRMHLRIDSKKGCGVDGSLHNLDYLIPNYTFEWTAEIHAKDKEGIEKSEELFFEGLAGINNGIIKFGAKKTSGAGSFKITDLKALKVNLTNKDELFNYLLDKIEYKKIDEKLVSNKNSNSSKYDSLGVNLESVTPLLIGGVDVYDKDFPDKVHIKSGEDKYIIPGSSIKGVLRSHCSKLADYFGCSDELINEIFGSDPQNSNNKELAPGRIIFNDYILEDVKDDAIVNKIHIDSFTSGVKQGALVEEKPVFGKFNLELFYRKIDDEEKDNKAIGLLLLALKDLSDGTLSMGGGYAIGRGRFKGEQIYLNSDIAIDFVNNKNSLAKKYVKSLIGEGK